MKPILWVGFVAFWSPSKRPRFFLPCKKNAEKQWKEKVLMESQNSSVGRHRAPTQRNQSFSGCPPFADWVMQAHADFFSQFFGNSFEVTVSAYCRAHVQNSCFSRWTIGSQQRCAMYMLKIEDGFMADKAWASVMRVDKSTFVFAVPNLLLQDLGDGSEPRVARRETNSWQRCHFDGKVIFSPYFPGAVLASGSVYSLFQRKEAWIITWRFAKNMSSTPSHQLYADVHVTGI